MKPRIGLTTRYETVDGRERINLLPAYADAVVAGGGTPLLLPPPGDDAGVEALLDACDGLLATGGGDLDPALWGEARHPKTKMIHPRRQRSDLGLIALADKRRMPVLGICLGCQEIAVSRGGSLIQHAADEPGATIEHSRPTDMRSTHPVTIEPDSLLARVVGREPLDANTSHHQAIREPGRGMRIVARSADGIVEAIEAEEDGRFLLAVQWHPEYFCDKPRHLALFEALCRAAAS